MEWFKYLTFFSILILHILEKSVLNIYDVEEKKTATLIIKEILDIDAMVWNRRISRGSNGGGRKTVV